MSTDEESTRTTQPEESEDSASVVVRLCDGLTDSPNYDEFEKDRHALAEWLAVRLMFLGVVVALIGVFVETALGTLEMIPEIRETLSDVALWWLQASFGVKFLITGIAIGVLGFFTLWYSMSSWDPPRNTEDTENEQ